MQEANSLINCFQEEASHNHVIDDGVVSISEAQDIFEDIQSASKLVGTSHKMDVLVNQVSDIENIPEFVATVNAVVPEDDRVTREEIANEQLQSMYDEHIAECAKNTVSSVGQQSNGNFPNLLSMIDDMQTFIQENATFAADDQVKNSIQAALQRIHETSHSTNVQ